MKLSVFVVTYNQEKYIRQCLDSILMQKVDFNYEVVIGEDHGTDGTRAICEEYAAKYSQIRLLPLTENLGIVKNWKRVLSECKGEYVAMCEGDDYWTDDLKLQKQVDFLESHKDYSICCHNVRDLNIHTNEYKNDFFTYSTPQVANVYDISARGNFIRTVSVVFRNCNLYEFMSLPLIDPIADFPLFALLLKNGNLFMLDECMAVYRDGGIWSTGNLTKNNIVMAETTKLLLKYFDNSTILKNLEQCIFRKYGFVAVLFHYQKKRLKELEYLRKTLLYVRTINDLKSFIKNYLFKIGSKELIESLS